MDSFTGNRRLEGSSSLEALSDVFKCFICMEQLDNARMCPHCSKLCCYACICKWITENKAQCPHCRRTLFAHALINCRWADDVIQQLDRLKFVEDCSVTKASDPNADLCESHNERLSVYCATCDRVICHRCALFDDRHGQHTFRPLDEVYQEHVDVIKNEMERLKSRRDEIQRLITDVRDSIMILNAKKESRVEEIKKVVESIMLRLESCYTCKLSALTDQRNHLTQEGELLNSLLHEVEIQLSSTTPANLILRSPTLSALFAEVHKTPMPSINCDYSLYDFASDLVPPYATGEFVIHNFSRLRRRAEPTYSHPLECGPLRWRLKVYPNGNGIVRGQYLSVFLEMISGRKEPSKYEYFIQLMHQGPPQDSAKCIAREFASDFVVGECWGYNRFIRLDLLDSEGYVSPLDDSLCFNYMVRPQTYEQQCRDYLWYITQLEDQKEQFQGHMRQLEAQLLSQRSFSASSEQLGPSLLPNGSQGLGIVGEGDRGDSFRFSVTSESCRTPAATPAAHSGGGEKNIPTSTLLTANDENAHTESRSKSEANPLPSDTEIDSDGSASDVAVLALDLLPGEIHSEEGVAEVVDDISSAEDDGMELRSESSPVDSPKNQYVQEKDLNDGNPISPFDEQDLVSTRFVTTLQSNGSNVSADIAGSHEESARIPILWTSGCIGRLLQRLSTGLPEDQQGESRGEGRLLLSTQQSTIDCENENQPEVFYDLLRRLKELNLPRSNRDLSSARHSNKHFLLPGKNYNSGVGDKLPDTDERRSYKRGPVSTSTFFDGSTAYQHTRECSNTDPILPGPVPTIDNLSRGLSSPSDLSVSSASSFLSMGTRMNLDVIRRRILEIQGGNTTCVSIPADSTPNQSSDSERESQRQSVSSSSDAFHEDPDENV